MLEEKPALLIVEDDVDVAEMVTAFFRGQGYEVFTVNWGEEAIDACRNNRPDLVVLDIRIPDIDGFEVARRLRKNQRTQNIPIIFLTERRERDDRMQGLELGADDYVTKPFSPKELVARVKVVLRRQIQKDDTKKIEIGGILVIDLEKFAVKVEGEKIDLTSTEFKILELLSSKQGWVFSRDKILDYLWGREKAVLDRTVDVHVKNLREKLGTAGRFIKNMRGIGYKLEA